VGTIGRVWLTKKHSKAHDFGGSVKGRLVQKSVDRS